MKMPGEPKKRPALAVIGAIGPYCTMFFALEAVIHAVGAGGCKWEDKPGIFPGPGFEEVGKCGLYFRWIHYSNGKLSK